MGKAISLSVDDMAVAQPLPPAATRARSVTPPEPVASPAAESARVPLQIRIPREDAKAIRVRAATLEMSISDYMLACVHAEMSKA